MKPYGRLILVTLFTLLLSATALWADDDPPGRVARLQYISGSVSIQPQGTQDWVEGALNRPLTISDNIWTDKNARAELNVGTGILRMNDETSVTFTNLDDRTVQVELHQGTLSLHIRKLYNGEIYEIDTPNFAFTIQKSGDYRFDVAPEGDTSLVKVFKGEGYATGNGPAVRVRSEEEGRFSNGTSLEHTFASLRGYDGFDDWGRVRDKRLDKSISGQYVSSDVIGYEDLDEYGSWRTVPDYGPIWVPTRVVTGWTPYRYGHWVYVNPWGWTWVDDAPWGFAPSHYGRWVYYNNYWGWAPGPRYVRPVYAPALVAWFGGRNWGVSLGFGGGPGYGWCPLGYGEPFVPWYRGSRNYFRNVNVSNTRITNITNITNNYYNNPRGGGNRNFANLRGATAVSEQTIVGGRPVSGAIVRVPQGEFAKAPRGGLNNLAPTRDSRLGGRQTVQAPTRSFARPVVSKLQAPARNPESGVFNRGGRPQSGAIQAKPGETQRMPNIGQGARSPEQTASGSNGSPTRNVPRPGSDNGPRSGAIRSGNGISNGVQTPNRPTSERNVPRPPDRGNGPGIGSGAINNGGDRNNGTDRTNAGPRIGQDNNNSPRSGAIVSRPSEQGGNQNMPQRNEERSVPRPPASNNNVERGSGAINSGAERNTTSPRMGQDTNNGNRGNGNGGNNNGAAPSQRNFSRPSDGGGRTMSTPRNVPRPTGRVLPASSRSVDYRSPQSSRSFAPSRGTSQNNTMAPRSYSAPSRSYGMSSSRSYQQPRSYSSPSYSSPRYGSPSVGNGSPRYSAGASSRSAPASHGGGSGGGRSFGGGGNGGGGRFGRH